MTSWIQSYLYVRKLAKYTNNPTLIVCFLSRRLGQVFNTRIANPYESLFGNLSTDVDGKIQKKKLTIRIQSPPVRIVANVIQ
jgi:hypothetical protein